LYFESGIYLELKAFVGVDRKEWGVSKEFKFKLVEAGDKYLYVEACKTPIKRLYLTKTMKIP